jgi:hypothetical protein
MNNKVAIRRFATGMISEQQFLRQLGILLKGKL